MAGAGAGAGAGAARAPRVRFARTEDGDGGALRPLWVLLPAHLGPAAVEGLLASVATRMEAARATPAGAALAENTRAVGLDMQPVSQPVCTVAPLVDAARDAFRDALAACKTAYAAQRGAAKAGPGLAAADAADADCMAPRADLGANADLDFGLELDLAGLDRERQDLTSLGWLYGPKSSMLAHHDTPTFAGSSDEWLVSFNAGLTMIFEADGEELALASGDVVVMDTLAVKHGVRQILPGSAPKDCSVQDVRVGLLLWSSFNPDVEARAALAANEAAAAEGVAGLFPSESDSDEDADPEDKALQK